jgi:hypothetical protein
MVKKYSKCRKILVKITTFYFLGNPLLDFYGQYAAAAAAAGFPAVTQAMIAPSAAITQGTIDSNAMQGESPLLAVYIYVVIRIRYQGQVELNGAVILLQKSIFVINNSAQFQLLLI